MILKLLKEKLNEKILLLGSGDLKGTNYKSSKTWVLQFMTNIKMPAMQVSPEFEVLIC